ncbi:hypothetical protein PFISCL1PPCAC_138, partial [Pristionchus fissidentatus]
TQMDDIYGSEWLVFISMMVQLIMTPGTKVEESFNLQATHDLLYHGTNLSAYDHHEFPGVVPRTFAGPLALATIAAPLRAWQMFQPFNKMWMQLLVRGILGSLMVVSFLRFARAVQWYLGREVANNLRVIVATQFHFAFYASRPLPNTFALCLVLYAVALWLEDDLHRAARWAIAATMLFRFELVLLFGPLFIPSLLNGRIPLLSPLKQSAVWIAASTVAPLVVCFLPLDSLLWGHLCWPELDVIRFNVLDNRSHEYGTAPLLWYFYSALPRSLLLSMVFIPLGLIFDHRRLLPLISPFIVFVALYSLLPHKELRFILYVVPVLSVPAAVFFARLYLNRHKSLVSRVLSWGFYGLIATNLAANALFTMASVNNYPGGDALSWLQHSQRFDRAKPRSVHIDVYSAQTGVSRFYHQNAAWEYNKTEGLTPAELARFDFLIVGSDEPLKPLIERDYAAFRPMVMIRGFARMDYRIPKSVNEILANPPMFLPSIEVKERVVVLKKRDE